MDSLKDAKNIHVAKIRKAIAMTNKKKLFPATITSCKAMIDAVKKKEIKLAASIADYINDLVKKGEA